MKVNELKTSELTRVYIQLRDRRAARKNEYDAVDASDKDKQSKIEGMLLARFAEEGMESVRTEFGTAYKSIRTSASVADKDVFMNYVKENNLFELLEVRASKPAVEAYRDEFNDLPPAINWREEVTINVKRS